MGTAKQFLSDCRLRGKVLVLVLSITPQKKSPPQKKKRTLCPSCSGKTQKAESPAADPGTSWSLLLFKEHGLRLPSLVQSLGALLSRAVGVHRTVEGERVAGRGLVLTHMPPELQKIGVSAPRSRECSGAQALRSDRPGVQYHLLQLPAPTQLRVNLDCTYARTHPQTFQKLLAYTQIKPHI